MATPAIIAITPGSGQNLDAVQLTVGLNTVVRETMVIADPTSATQLAGVTAGGALQVDASATTQPISGTITANQGTSPWVVSLTSTTITGSVAVTGTFWQTTQPVSIASTVIVAGTLTHNNAAPAATQIGVLPAIANVAHPTYTEGDQVLLSTDLTGALRVNIAGTVLATNNIEQWNSVALGSPSAYGTSPGAVNVIGVNAYVTSLPAITVAAAQTIAVTNAGTFAVQATLSAETTKVIGTVNQGTSPWIVAGGGTAGSPGTAVLTVQGIGGGTAIPVSGSFYQATQPISIASGQVVSGAFSSGSIASGAVASGAIASGAIASGAIASGAIAAGAAAAGAFADGSVYVRSNAAATFPVTATIAAAQTIAVTNAGTFAVQASGTVTANQGTAGAVTAPWPTRPGSPMTASWLQLPINVSGLGANIIVPAVGGQTVRVMRIFFVNSDPTNATNVTVQDTSPTSFTGPVRLITAGSFNGQDSNGEPLFVSGTGQGIQINSTAAVQLSGTIWFTQS